MEIKVSKYQNRVLVYGIEGGFPMFFDIDGRGKEIFPTGIFPSFAMSCILFSCFFLYSMLHSGVPQITSSVILNEVGLNLTSFVGLMQAYLRIIHSFVWLIVFHFSLCSLEGP